MRADARAIHGRILEVAGGVIADQGTDASMRDIARRADVGLATLLRHFPTRDALLEALLRTSFDELTDRAGEVEITSPPADALTAWLRDFITTITSYRGVVTAMTRAIDDPDSALHDSCVAMRASGTRLLTSAQSAGAARNDIDGPDLFALASSLAWLGDQPGLHTRVDHLVDVVLAGVLPPRLDS